MSVDPDPQELSQGSELGDYIRLERTRLGLSQRDVAEEVGVSQQSVSSWERGIVKPRPDLVPTLSKTLGAAILQLTSDERSVEPRHRRHLRPVSDFEPGVLDDGPRTKELTREQRSFRDALVQRVKSGQPLTDAEIRFLRNLADLHDLRL